MTLHWPTWRSRLATLAPILLALALLVPAHGMITTAPNKDDAAQNMIMAYHLFKNRIFSRSEENQGPEPTRAREPLPPAVTALWMMLDPQIVRADRLVAYQADGEPVRRAKLVNLLWVSIALASVGLLTQRMSGSLLAAVAGPLSLFILVFYQSRHVDRLTTEAPAIALTSLLTLFLYLGTRSGRLAWYALAGLTAGALVLTKAAFLYILPVALVLIAAFALWSERGKARRHILGIACLTAVAAAPIAAWSVRNHALFGSWTLTERGPLVLLVRATKNGMSSEELRGAFYHWGPQAWKRPLGSLLGFSRDDLELGGSLQRLNRNPNSTFAKADRDAIDVCDLDRPISFLIRARVEANCLLDGTASGAGRENEETSLPLAQQKEINKAITARALHRIMSDPLAHLTRTPAFAWRGTWFFQPENRRWVVIANFAAMLVVLAAPIYAMARRRLDIFVVGIIAVGIFAFHSLLTHNLPRYNAPMAPAMIALSLTMITALAARLARAVRLEALTPRVIGALESKQRKGTE